MIYEQTTLHTNINRPVRFAALRHVAGIRELGKAMKDDIVIFGFLLFFVGLLVYEIICYIALKCHITSLYFLF